MSTPKRGRQRSLTSAKQAQLCRLVAQGRSIAQAADQVEVSLRTVQREKSRDEDFEHDLALAQESAPVDPLKLMHEAARAHWRAAAWLLERTDPEHYARRRADACSAEQFKSVLAALIEAALAAAPAEHRPAVYQRTQAIADEALRQLFPHHAPAPFAPPPGLAPHILTREQQTNAFLDHVALDYQRPAPSAAASDSSVESTPLRPAAALSHALPPQAASRQPSASRPPAGILSPKISPAPADPLPRHHDRLNTSAPAASPAAHPFDDSYLDPAKRAYLFGRLADRLRHHLAAAQRPTEGPERANAVLSPKTTSSPPQPTVPCRGPSTNGHAA